LLKIESELTFCCRRGLFLEFWFVASIRWMKC
jgi:hypothetical protein